MLNLKSHLFFSCLTLVLANIKDPESLIEIPIDANRDDLCAKYGSKSTMYNLEKYFFH